VSPEPSDSALVVLESVPAPRPTTNPYVVQLLRSLESVPGVTVLTFSWRTALLGKYDVFHVHWPENLAQGHSPAKSLARRVLTRLLLSRLRRRRIPIVRTLHNLERPSGLSPAEYRILERLDTRTTLTVRLNDLTPIADGTAFETIPHGHYRDWFAPFPRSATVAGRLGYFGLIRRYKNVAHLVSVATSLPSDFSLRVAGSPSTPEIAAEVRAARDSDNRITLDFHFLSDAELVEVVTESELVVLPYTEMHNSGSVLACLSLGRPVLLQDNAVNRALSAEVGAGWITLYEHELEVDDILSAFASIAASPPTAEPDLRLREWNDVGERHVAAYRRALVLARR
jgi:beta-1,4-mannosyltransferase